MEKTLLLNLLVKIKKIAGNEPVWVAGGPVRDLALGRNFLDLDLVVPQDAIHLARRFAEKYGGTFLVLHDEEGVARVVIKKAIVDFSQFRGNAETIEQDLLLRDFSINGMALSLEDFAYFLKQGSKLEEILDSPALIDPVKGREDLKQGLIRAISRKNLEDDPLRLVRAFRFMAELGFKIEDLTLKWIQELAPLIRNPAPERVDHELHLIMASNSAAKAFKAMLDVGLLFELFPEIEQMSGVDQPGFHHLDVLGHSIEALRCMEKLIKDPCIKFSNCEKIKHWLKHNGEKIPALKWAAFFHDVGKPVCKGQKGERVTFYEHDSAGANILKEIAKRLRWPKKRTEFAALLIRLHMRPFHLLNDLRKSGPTKRAMRRLIKEIGDDYPALFLLAMADSMAGKGPLKPPELDDELARLWEKIDHFHQNTLKPVKSRPRLLTGNDLQQIFGLPQGPLIGQILDAIEEAQVEGKINNKQQAISLVTAFLKDNSKLEPSK